MSRGQDKDCFEMRAVHNTSSIWLTDICRVRSLPRHGANRNGHILRTFEMSVNEFTHICRGTVPVSM
jgi:hypothetical protein